MEHKFLLLNLPLDICAGSINWESTPPSHSKISV
jgi:hypothetical protein